VASGVAVKREAIAVAGARTSAFGQRVCDAAPEERKVREHVGVEAELARPDVAQQGLEFERARGGLRQPHPEAEIRLLAADQPRHAAAALALDRQRQQQHRPARSVAKHEDARREAHGGRARLHIGPHPIVALIGRGNALVLQVAPERFDLGRLVEVSTVNVRPAGVRAMAIRRGSTASRKAALAVMKSVILGRARSRLRQG
jgi:hypothetical protein